MSYDHPYSGDDSNFIKKHWNGDYSLAKSYWVNTFLVSLALLLGVKLFYQSFSERTEARYVSITALLVTALAIAVQCWATIGTWRSASKHVSRGGKSFWAIAVMVLLVLGTVRTLNYFVTRAPLFAQLYRVALGQQFGPETRIRVSADGRSLVVSGGMNDDTAGKLRQALNRAPGVKTIVLSSRGGWVGQGEAVADVVSSRRVDTRVEDECSSACTIAFLAGRERTAAPKARIGFHSFRMIDGRTSARTSALLLKVYGNAGLSDEFIQRVLKTPADEVWYPTPSELIRNGVLTQGSVRVETSAR